MSRNSSGIYSLPAGINPVVTDTLITANWGNTTMEDVAAALTESLSRNGQGGMLAPLKLTSGSAAAPALSFTASTSTGVYRNASGQMNFAVNGAERFRMTTDQNLLPDGTAALPALGFISDPDTGIYSSADNALSFATGGALRATLTNTTFTLEAGVAFTGSGAGLTAIPAANLTGTVPPGTLTTLNASNLTSGTVPDARFPATLPATSGVNLTALNASNLGSGTVPDARFPATLPAASGVNLTNLPAASLTGNIAQARIATALNASGSAPLYSVRAWIYFDALSGTPTIKGSGNVSSITDNGVGDYTVNFTTAMPSANYGVGAMCSQNILGNSNGFSVGVKSGTTLLAGGVNLAVKNIGSSGGIDTSEVCAIFVA